MKLKALTTSRPAGIIAGGVTLLLALSAAVALAVSGDSPSDMRQVDGTLAAGRTAFRDALAANAGANDLRSAERTSPSSDGATVRAEIADGAQGGSAIGEVDGAPASAGGDALYRENLRAAGSARGGGGIPAGVGAAIGGLSAGSLMAAASHSRRAPLSTVVNSNAGDAVSAIAPTDPLAPRPLIERAPPPASTRPRGSSNGSAPAAPSAATPATPASPGISVPAVPAVPASNATRPSAPSMPQPPAVGLVDADVPTSPTTPLGPPSNPGGKTPPPATSVGAKPVAPGAPAAVPIVTPEPGTFALLGGGLLAMGMVGLKRRRRTGR